MTSYPSHHKPESEAGSLWCPFSRTTLYVRGDDATAEKPHHLIGHGANRLIVDDPALNAVIAKTLANTGATRCLGSKCAAWRVSGYDSDLGFCGLVP